MQYDTGMKFAQKAIFCGILLILGFGFRYLITAHSYQPIIFDSLTYHRYALEILSGKLTSSCCIKNMGYSMFLAMVYYFFGANNSYALRLIQIMLDLLTAILIYLTARRLFTRQVAFYSFVIYLVNPLTSAYAGLHLSEVFSVFLVAVAVFAISGSGFRTNRGIWIIWGIMMGILVFVRPQFKMFAYIMIFFAGLVYFRKTAKIVFIGLAFIGLCLGSAYSLISYYADYRVFSLTPPYSGTWIGLAEIYDNDFRWIELNSELSHFMINPGYVTIADEYNSVTDLSQIPMPKDQIPVVTRQIPQLDLKYKHIFYERLPHEWPKLVHNVWQNILWLWDKYHLSAYTDEYYPADLIPVRIYNMVMLLLFATGIIGYAVKNMTLTIRSPVFGFTVLLFCYMTFAFSLVSNETRHTIPFYPLVFLWAGRGISTVQHTVRKIFRQR
jgi:4-amino-4-deoxy-L-arabinose transferase-like glycosyltransferase